jgi:alcohol dehydrogenase, propanol-preferring
MRALRLTHPGPAASGPLAMVEEADPRPGPDDLVLRLSACAVCRTDLQICEGDIAPRAARIVPGHQLVGRVVAIGANVEGWRDGDRAGAAWLGGACGRCPRCVEGRENLCEKAIFTGWDVDGGFATHARVRADFALRLADAFEDEAAAPLLCGGVIGYRALKVSGIRPGQRLGLYGFGASALLSMQIARFWGCRVFVCTRSKEEQARARSLGAEWAGGYDEPPPARLDAAVTFAPVGSVVVAALKAIERGGTVAINAIHLDEIPALDYGDLWWERSLRSVSNFTRRDARELLDLAARIPIRPRVDAYDLADANLALARLKSGDVSGAAVLRIPP